MLKQYRYRQEEKEKSDRKEFRIRFEDIKTLAGLYRKGGEGGWHIREGIGIR